MEYRETHHNFGDDRGHPVAGEMQVVFKDNEVYAVDFLCPCGCGSTCYTPIVCTSRPRTDGNRPIWDYSPGPTLSPSIRFTGGCKAHFFITGGKAIMCDDSGK